MGSAVYEKYAKRMRKVAAFRNFVRRNKWWFIASATAVAVTIGTLLSIRGNITEDNFPAEATFVYGQGFSAQAGALMGEASFEYSPADKEEWSADIPVHVGKYKARAVSKGTFGNKYGAVHLFEITPKEANLIVPEQSIYYGNLPYFSDDGLLDGHHVEEIEWDFDDYDSLDTSITVTALKVKNALGEDITGDYAFSLPQTFPLTLAPRPISITFPNESLTYDGFPHSSSTDYTIGLEGLAYQDELSFTPANEVYAGTYSTSEVKILSPEGVDHSSLYNMTLNAGSMKINTRPLSLSSGSYEKVYDGHPIQREDRGSIHGVEDIVDQDNFTYSFNTPEEAILFPGTYENSFTYELDHLDSYDVKDPVYGTIKISKRPLHISVEGAWAYEGQTFYPGDADSLVLSEEYYRIVDDTSLAYGDELSLSIQGEIYGKPVYSYSLTRNGEDASSYYQVTFDGAIAFSKAELFAEGKEDSYVYDGKPHALDYEVHGLKGSDTCDVSFVSANTSLTKVGKITSKLNVSNIRSDDGLDKASFYKVSTSDASVKITKRPLVIEDHGVFSYDGVNSPYRDLELGVDYSIVSGSLAEGDTLRVYPTPNTLFTNQESMSYSIVNEADEDVFSCYEFEVDSSSHSEKVPLSIIGSSEEIVYDGKPHDLTYTLDQTLPNDDYEIAQSGDLSGTDVGTYSSSFTLSKATNLISEEVTTSYYEVSSIDASLKISKRPIFVYAHPNYTYMGSLPDLNLNASQYEVGTGENAGLAEGHQIEISLTKDPFLLEEGEDPTLDIHIYSDTWVDVTKNYDISYGLDVGVNRPVFEVHAYDVEVTYDGYPHGCMYEVSGLQVGDLVAISPDQNPIYPGVYTITYTFDHIYSSNEENRDPYYTIPSHSASATLTINPRPLSITCYPHGNDPFYELSNSLAFRDYLSWSISDGSPGEYNVFFSLTRDGENIEHAYDLGPMGFAFAKRDVTVLLADEEYMYDGVSREIEPTADGLCLGDTILFTDKSRLTKTSEGFSFVPGTNNQKVDVGEYEYSYTVSKIQDSEGHDVTSAYNIVDAPSATLKITPRPIGIEIYGDRYYSGSLLSYALSSYEYAITGEGLASGDTITITPVESTILTGVETEFTYSIKNGSKTKTGNYSVTSLTSTMVFHPATLYVNGQTGEVQYFDGKGHSPTVTGDNLYGDDKLTNVVTDPSSGDMVNVGNYDYDILSAEIKNGSTDKTKYYDIHYGSGSLEIKSTDIALDLGSYTGIYDGVTSYALSSYLDPSQIRVTGLSEEGHHYLDPTSVSFVGSISALGVTEFTKDNVNMESLRILDIYGADVTSQYNVQLVSGQVELLQMTVLVGASAATEVYSGKDISLCAFASIEEMDVDWGKVNSYSVTAVMSSAVSLSEVGNYLVPFTASMVTLGVRKGNSYLEPTSYKIRAVITQVPVNILKRSVVYASGNVEDETGYEVSFGTELRLVSGSLVEGDTFISIPPSPRVFDTPGVYRNDGWDYRIVNSSGRDVTHNYSVTIQYGTVTIN